MFQSQQQSQQSSFTNLAHPTNYTANFFLQFPQPPPFPPEPLLLPPGTDNSHSGSFALTNVEFQGQLQYYGDLNVGSGSWITTQVYPIGYDTSSSVAALNFFNNSSQMNQTLVNSVKGNATNQIKMIQPVRCEVCNIQCDTQDVYEKHLMGKKHQKNLQAKSNLATAGFPETANTIASGVTNVQELENKKQKLLSDGPAVDSVRMCTICNVACNSDIAFNDHLSGKRHAAQAKLIAGNGIGPYIAAIRANDHFRNKGKKTTKVNQSTWCQVCKVNCTSNDAYAKHLSGKKHLKKLEKLENLKNDTSAPPLINTPAATNLTIGPVENSASKCSSGDNVQKLEKRAAQSDAPKEVLETKKRKITENGTAATAVKVCTICNIACNSQKVFKYHLSGQKHAAMIKRQADARISAASQTIMAI